MTRQELNDLLLSFPGSVWDYQAEWGWDRYRVSDKMFAGMCCVGPEHASVYAGHPVLNLKCDPLESEALRKEYPDILPGFYMDKRCWIAIRLDGSVPDPLISCLCRKSYQLVFDKLTRKTRQKILQQAGNEAKTFCLSDEAVL